MKKITYKSLHCIIVFFLIFTYLFPILSYANIESYKSYVAFGDSISYGYGLESREEDSYPAKVRKKCNIEKSNFKNLSVSGMKCAEFNEYIRTDEITQAIKNTELITISIGSNEILGIVTDAIRSATGVVVENDEDFIEKVREKINSVSHAEKLVMLKKFYDDLTSEKMKVKIENAIETYKEKWTDSIKYIKQINPDVHIVATEFYNPYYEVSVLSYDFGGFVDENIQKMNQILWDNSNSEKEYSIAKIYDEFNTTEPRLTNVDLETSYFNVDPHPNLLGHEVICTKILDILSSETDKTKKDIYTLTILDILDQNYTGKEIKPTVVIKDGEKQLIENIDYTVSYSENIEIGEAKVTIIGIGNYKGKVIKTFNIKNIEQKDIKNLQFNSIEDKVYTGIKITPDIEIFDGKSKLIKNTDYRLDYKNNINVGSAIIIISGVGNYTGTVEKEFNIIEKDIKDTTIIDIPDQVYTGAEIVPQLEILDGSAKLVKDVDYTVEYRNNIDKGTGTVTVKGKGNYTGRVEKQFNIIERKQEEKKDISKLNISDIPDKIYTGKLITPEVVIKDGEKTLIKNTDYIINYFNNMNVGVGKISIVGIGQYTGKVEKNFNILRKNISNTTIKDIEDQLYTGKEIEPELVITSDYIQLKEGIDYTKEYKNNIEEGTAIIEIKGIGNYTGTVTKTFNINRKEENKKQDNNSQAEEKTNSNKEDNTIADKKIPLTGKKVLICMFVVLDIIIAVIFCIKYNKLKIVK